MNFNNWDSILWEFDVEFCPFHTPSHTNLEFLRTMKLMKSLQQRSRILRKNHEDMRGQRQIPTSNFQGILSQLIKFIGHSSHSQLILRWKFRFLNMVFALDFGSKFNTHVQHSTRVQGSLKIIGSPDHMLSTNPNHM